MLEDLEYKANLGCLARWIGLWGVAERQRMKKIVSK